ncbi:YcaO-like family protein [Devosia soli]|uniref:YcaO-like family protein n=1 Tax=Devosia soli TaxID=361041 RepID=UPI00069BD968|nr:YcaO-like family protein [Devosia soli]
MLTSDHLDRVAPLQATLAAVKAKFPELGITRLARQTDLDIIGIPCWAAFRPAANALAVNQGKGLSDDAAKVSAAMEAAEFAIAEHPRVATIRASAADLELEGPDWFNPSRSLPLGAPLAIDQAIEWVSGSALFERRETLVPLDLVRLGHATDLPGICQSTNGLASGNTPAEAIFHGLCELIERDAETHWSILPQAERMALCFDPSVLNDPVVDDLCARFAAAGVPLRLFDLTTDIAVPTFMALAGDGRGSRLELMAGYGTHPSPVRAAVKAITEVAQGRVTVIASARDDIALQDYADRADPGLSELAMADPVHHPQSGTYLSASVDGLLNHIGQALLDAGIDDVTSVSLGSDDLGFSVVRVLCDDLEDRGPNAHWRPGHRALHALGF